MLIWHIYHYMHKAKKYWCRDRNRGNIMLLSVLVSTGMLAVGVSLGVISVKRLKQTGQATDSLSAYYTAETAAEEAVYKIRKLGTSSDALTEAGSGWTRSVTQNASGIKIDLRHNEWVDIDLHGSDGSWAADVSAIYFHWSDRCRCTILNVSTRPLHADGSVGVIQQNIQISSETLVQGVSNIALNPDDALRVRITAQSVGPNTKKEGYVDNLTMTAVDSGGNPSILSTAIRINASGSAGLVNQGVELILE